MLCFPHHKNESRWDFLPIEFEVPDLLAQRLMPWITMGHKEHAAPGQRLLFYRFHQKTGMQAMHLSGWFTDMLSTYKAPFRFAPRELRHIFVDERCGSQSVAGPLNKGAARVMGNRYVSSQGQRPFCARVLPVLGTACRRPACPVCKCPCSVERWEISYDRNLHTREVNAAVQAMNAWRTELLELVDM